MKVTYDPEVDVLRILLSDASIEESDEDKPGVILDYDKDGNIVRLEKPSHATDSELTDDDVIIRYEGEAVVGYTILHASQRDLKS